MATNKIELTDKGWNEIVITSIEITEFSSREPFMTITEWIAFNKKYPKIGRKRKTCNCCKNSWEKLEGGVNLIFTNKGNKSVCDECLSLLKERMINN